MMLGTYGASSANRGIFQLDLAKEYDDLMFASVPMFSYEYLQHRHKKSTILRKGYSFVHIKYISSITVCLCVEKNEEFQRWRTKNPPIINPGNIVVPPLFHGSFPTVKMIFNIFLSIFDRG